MHIRSCIAAGLLALVLAPSAFAQDTATSDLVLARDACGAGGTLPPSPRLAFTPGASTLGCGSLLAITGGAPTAYPATEGVPVTLDPSRPITVAISSSSYTGVALGGIGAQTVKVLLTGVNAATKKSVVLGEGSQTTPAEVMLRQATSVNEFTFDITGKGATYKALELTLTVGGSQFAGFVDHDGTSFVSLPVFDSSVPTE